MYWRVLDSAGSGQGHVAGCHEHGMNERFLGAFAKLRKATISFAMFFRHPVGMEQLDSHWTEFDEI